MSWSRLVEGFKYAVIVMTVSLVQTVVGGGQLKAQTLAVPLSFTGGLDGGFLRLDWFWMLPATFTVRLFIVQLSGCTTRDSAGHSSRFIASKATETV
jgi:hypothetical protein